MGQIFIIFSIIILLIVLFFIVKTLNKIKKEQNLTAEEIWNKNKTKYEEEIEQLTIKKSETLENYKTLLDKLEQVSTEVKLKEDFNNSLFKIREDEMQRVIEEKKKEAVERMNLEVEQLRSEKIGFLKAEFSSFQAEQNESKQHILQDISKLNKEFEDFRSQREAINLAILREKEIKDKEDFFKIIISQNDQEDIETLKTISPRLKNQEALNKLIYDVFVKRPLNELIKRITAGREISGIYKITYIKTGEAYIGKTTNISTRWQNHVKTACGLEGAAHSTFHTRLEQDGIWNYTFEILEEVSKDKLSEKEKFYIDLYGTHKQLNMKKG